MAPYIQEGAPKFERPKARFQIRPTPDTVPALGPTEATINALKPFLQGEAPLPGGGQLFAAVLVPPNGEEGPIQFWSRNVADGELANRIRNVIDQSARNQALIDAGIEPTLAQQAMATTVELIELDPTKRAGEEEEHQETRHGRP